MTRPVRSNIAGIIVILSLAVEISVQAQTSDEFSRQRKRMIDEIAAMARDARLDTGRAEFAAPVMAAIDRVPREGGSGSAAKTGQHRDSHAQRGRLSALA